MASHISDFLPALSLLLVFTFANFRLPDDSPIWAHFRKRRVGRERKLWEDVLRQILQMEQDGRIVSLESLAGAMGRSLSLLRQIIGRMAEHDLVTETGATLRLTHDGKRWALHILRAHRLWESYLADEAGLPMSRLHRQAEAAEHRLTESDLEALDAHLGHPAEDPHGDPIPTAEGRLAEPRGVPLSQWEGGEHVRVVHLEDEPQDVLNKILSKGIRPGATLRIDEIRPQSISVIFDGASIELERELLPNVEIVEDRARVPRDPNVIRLSLLPTGQRGEVLSLSSAIRGFSRRRLLDFGVTPGTTISPILDNPFGDPRAFRVRGTTIGIRGEQASEIWVRREPSDRTEAGGAQ